MPGTPMSAGTKPHEILIGLGFMENVMAQMWFVPIKTSIEIQLPMWLH